MPWENTGSHMTYYLVRSHDQLTIHSLIEQVVPMEDAMMKNVTSISKQASDNTGRQVHVFDMIEIGSTNHDLNDLDDVMICWVSMSDCGYCLESILSVRSRPC